MSSPSWQTIAPDAARDLTDARLQVHHAAQLATAFGISYLPPSADDSHTNLEWLPDSSALASNALRDMRVALSVADLTLRVADATIPLQGRTVADAADWVRARLASARLDPERYTIARHYEIPAHAVATGAPFDADPARLEQLARWFGNAAVQLERLRAANANASEVRCWPHHFDLATLITVAPEKTVGVGLEPGDAYYDEPYFYVNLHPSPSPDALPPFAGDGSWHTHQWIGAVLPASRLRAEGAAQNAQVTEFLDSAVTQAIALVRR